MLTTVNNLQNLVTGRSDTKNIFVVAALRLGCPATAYDSRFYELHVQRDSDFLPNQDSARFQRRIPSQAVSGGVSR
jgi:hypothetical protein